MRLRFVAMRQLPWHARLLEATRAAHPHGRVRYWATVASACLMCAGVVLCWPLLLLTAGLVTWRDVRAQRRRAFDAVRRA